MNWAISGAYTLPHAKRDELIGFVDAALDRLRKGIADREDWVSLANGINIAEALAYFQIGSNLSEQLAAALKALGSVAARMLGGGSSACYATELAAIVEGRDLYRIQLGLCSQAEMMRAVARVNDLHRSGAMQDVKRTFDGLAMEAEATG